MIDIDIAADRGSLKLKIRCTLDAPWTVLFGPSGAGKTTLLRLIAGLEKPKSGTIVIDRPGRFGSPGKLGMVTQRSALFPNLTAAQNVAYGLSKLPRPERQQRTHAMLELVGAASLFDRSPAGLSGGEAQRVSLARALAPAPNLLLLDEPLSALDAASRDGLLTALQQWLGEQNIQTILVTHDAADALATDAEILVLNQGQLTAQGPAHQVLASERARILARLATPATPSGPPGIEPETWNLPKKY